MFVEAIAVGWRLWPPRGGHAVVVTPATHDFLDVLAAAQGMLDGNR